jgi:hypothetical protein
MLQDFSQFLEYYCMEITTSKYNYCWSNPKTAADIDLMIQNYKNEWSSILAKGKSSIFRVLGVFLTLNLNWQDQFKVSKDLFAKMISIFHKGWSSPWNTAALVNTDLLTKIIIQWY